MGKKPKPEPSILSLIFARSRSRWKLILAVVGGVTILLGGVKAIAESWDTLEAHVAYTTHWFVRNEVKVAQSSTTAILRDIQIDRANDKRERAANELNQWNLEKTKPGYQSDSQTRAIIDHGIGTTQSTIEKLDQQLRALNRQRDGN